MFLIAVPLLILAIWPFHRKTQVKPPEAPPTIVIGPEVRPGDPVVPESICTHDPILGYELRGPDGATGYSLDSCQGAFDDWKTKPPNPWKIDRT
jgi:hypothetical protein